MTDISRLLDPSRPERSSIGTVQRGRINKAPTDESDSLEVAVLRYSADMVYDVPAENWMPRGPVMPTAGTDCLVLVDDLGDAHVPVYMGANSSDTAFAFFSGYEIYKVLAAADLPILVQPPPLINSPLRDMMSAEEATERDPETLIYTVPDRTQAIVKMIVCTSDVEDQDITLRCYTELGPIPLFGPIRLGPGEWAEWSGSLTLAAGGEIRGAINGGSVSIGIYGLERS